MATSLEDVAAKIIELLFNIGQANVEAVSVSGATVTVTTPDEFSVSVLTLAHATPAITLPAPTKGAKKRLYIVQDGTGSRIASWVATSGAINWLRGAAPTLTTTAAGVDIVDIESYDGTNWEATYQLAGQVLNGTQALSSGVAVQNTSGKAITVYVPITGAVSGTVAAAIGPDNTTGIAIIPAYAVGATTDGDNVAFRVPAGWYYKVTVANASIAASATWVSD